MAEQPKKDSPLAAREIGGFELIKKIGQGAMGTVFKARQKSLDRIVALKILPPSIAKNTKFIERFQREARSSAKLNHPNIVQGIDVGKDEATGVWYFAMELIDGPTLLHLLDEQRVIPERRALEITRDIARALECAASHSIVHRDIKPDNILMTQTGEAKLADLGLARQINDDASLTQSGQAIGTPYYMAPEQVRGLTDEIDTRTDIYALGGTLFHLVTGQPPFSGESGAVIMSKHLTEPVPKASKVNPDVSESCSRMIEKMMQKNREQRIQTPAELIVQIERAMRGEMTTGPLAPIRAGVRRSRELPVAKKSSKGLIVVGIVAVLAIGAGAAYFVKQGGKPATPPVAAASPAPPKEKEKELPATAATPSATPPKNPKTPVESAKKPPKENVEQILDLVKPGDLDASTAAPVVPKTVDPDLPKKLPGVKDDPADLKIDLAKTEETRLAAETAKKKAEDDAKAAAATQALKPPDPAVKPEIPITPVAVQPETVNRKLEAAVKLFAAVLKETTSLLAQNKFADALALLERKAKDPALADAVELLKQEKADIEAVLELRRAGVEALNKMVGKEVALKKGAGTIKGKVKDDAAGRGVTLDIGGPVMTINADQVHVDDIDQFAPKQANAADDLRRRGIMFLYAGNVSKAKDYFTKAQDAGLGDKAAPYLDRITALEMGEIEAAALKAWENSEKLFAAKSMKAAKDAYESFEKQHGKTATATKQAATLKERYAAIEAVLGPPPTLSLDLGGNVKMEMVLVKAGEFMMGAEDGDGNEKPAHKVKISQLYYIDRYEVTVAQWRAFADATKYQTEAEKAGNKAWTIKDGKWQGDVPGTSWRTPGFKQEDNHPACVITWNDAQEFCKWATKLAGRTVRLPSEAEWEYAARGPKVPKYPWGDTWDGATSGNVADKSLKDTGFNMQWGEIKEDDGFPYTSPVGNYKNSASWCRAIDMAGNLWEWVEDRFSEKYYSESPAVDPKGPADGNDRVLRGGSWVDNPGTCRSVRRAPISPGHRVVNNGFRVVVVCASSRTP